MAVLPLEAVASATGGTVVSGDPGMEVACYAIDSRRIAGGELFFALVGERHDGHAFLDDVFARGAAAAVVSRKSPAGRPAVRVADTTQALRTLARTVRERWGGTVVGVTGSCGKTTSKEMLRLAVEGSRRVLATRGNLNNLYGLPLTLLELLPEHEVAVLEMGISTPGEMTELARIAQPDVMVMLNVAAVHLVHFDSVEAIAAAKGEALDVMGPRGTFVYNRDDAQLVRLAAGFGGPTLSFGLDPSADVHADELEEDSADRIAARFSAGGESVRLELPVPGRHNLLNALAAVAGARAVGVGLAASVARLAVFRPPRQRGERLALAGGITVWDESYNSNPPAMRAVLETLARARPRGRRVLVSGDMLELGRAEQEEHRHLAEAVAAAGVDLFFGVGPLSALTVETLRAGSAVEAIACADAAEAAEQVVERVASGDLIVVKGSRSVGTERIIDALVAARGELDA